MEHYASIMHVQIQRGGRGSGPLPLKNHENIGFLRNNGPDPLKIHKAAKPAFNVGPSSPPADGGQFIAVFGSSILSSTEKKRDQI